MTSVAV